MNQGIDILVESKYVATALLRPDVAPATAAAVWKILPVSTEMMHVTSSGEGIFFAINSPLDIDIRPGFGSDGLTTSGVVVQNEPLIRPENQTCFVSQGDLVITPYKACIIAYGRRCIIRAYNGDQPSNAFAYIRDPDQLDAFEKAAKRTLRYGAQRIELRQADPR